MPQSSHSSGNLVTNCILLYADMRKRMVTKIFAAVMPEKHALKSKRLGSFAAGRNDDILTHTKRSTFTGMYIRTDN